MIEFVLYIAIAFAGEVNVEAELFKSYDDCRGAAYVLNAPMATPLWQIAIDYERVNPGAEIVGAWCVVEFRS